MTVREYLLALRDTLLAVVGGVLIVALVIGGLLLIGQVLP